jgi:predicted nucleic acid-binding protein
MTFTDIPAGATVFVDANTLVYHFGPNPSLGPACRALLERFARQELVGYTSAHVVSNQVVDEIPGFGIQVLPVTMHLVSAAAAISQQHGLLSGDASVVAVMREHGLVNLASHDADFDRVAGLTRYAPA